MFFSNWKKKKDKFDHNITQFLFRLYVYLFSTCENRSTKAIFRIFMGQNTLKRTLEVEDIFRKVVAISDTKFFWALSFLGHVWSKASLPITKVKANTRREKTHQRNSAARVVSWRRHPHFKNAALGSVSNRDWGIGQRALQDLEAREVLHLIFLLFILLWLSSFSFHCLRFESVAFFGKFWLIFQFNCWKKSLSIALASFSDLCDL